MSGAVEHASPGEEAVEEAVEEGVGEPAARGHQAKVSALWQAERTNGLGEYAIAHLSGNARAGLWQGAAHRLSSPRLAQSWRM